MLNFKKKSRSPCCIAMWRNGLTHLGRKGHFQFLAVTAFLLLAPGLSAQDPMQDFRLLEPDTVEYTPVWTHDALSDQFNVHPGRKTDGWWMPRTSQQHKQAGWTIERVHSGKFFNHMGDRSLALDADGNPHIAYGGKHLYYAWYDGTAWRIDTVDDSWDVGYCTSLAFDSGGYPHISYYDRDPYGNLKHAYKNETGWHIQTVDSSNNSVGVYTSLAIDANDHVHISYCDITEGNLKFARWDGVQWHLETIDSGGYVGEFNSLALDAGGSPHISYFDYTNGHLKYARIQAGQWQMEIVDNDEFVGLYTSIALDPDGHAHISYLDYLQGNLKYAAWNGSQWETTTVDNSTYAGVFSSIALDANAHPHIAYYEDSGMNLKYAHYTGSDWDVKRLSPVGGVGSPSEGYYTSIALDQADQPHISHLGQGTLLGSQVGLRYIRLDGTEWIREELDYWLEFGATSAAVDDMQMPHIGYIKTDHSMGYATRTQAQWQFHNFKPTIGLFYHFSGSASFLALDANQRPHLTQQISRPHTYLGMPPYTSFIYRWYDGSAWQQNNLYSSAWNNRREVLSSSLIVDENDQPHISYYLIYGSQISPGYAFKYIYRSNNQWYESNIETMWAMGIDHSLALGHDGLPQLSYRSMSSFRYARIEGGQWNKQTIGGSETGSWSSIKTDANNLPHISFYDGANGSLKYMHWNGTQWTTETVDDSGEVGSYSSLDLDANGVPHISYFDVTNRNLKYAYRAGGQWQIEVVDNYRNVGRFTSLEIDAEGHPHISYVDDSFCDLKYATKAATPTEYTLTFVVENAYGDPIADAVVTLDGTEYPPGHYVFPGLEPGTYNYGVFRNCYQTAEGQVAITNANEEVEVFLVNLPGDANNDGVVNVSDVIVITNYYMGQNPQPFCFINADVNLDGVINVQDVIGAVNIFMGPRSATPVNAGQKKVLKQ